LYIGKLYYRKAVENPFPEGVLDMTLEALLARIGEKRCPNFHGLIMPRKSYAQTKDKPTLARFTVRKPPA
jgi:hypothetical protein